MNAVVVLAGPIAVGKSTLATELAASEGATVITARRAVEEASGLRGESRAQLQAAGADIDARTEGRWLSEYLSRVSEAGAVIVVDSVRSVAQAEHIRRSHPSTVVVYLDADRGVRAARYRSSGDPIKAGAEFAEAMDHPTETGVVAVAAIADIVIDTTLSTPRQVAERVRALMLERPGSQA